MTDTTFPPFSGDEVACPKCGNEGADTTYLAHGRCVHPGLVIGYKPNERLHRTCHRCNHQWDEATITATGINALQNYLHGSDT